MRVRCDAACTLKVLGQEGFRHSCRCLCQSLEASREAKALLCASSAGLFRIALRPSHGIGKTRTFWLGPSLGTGLRKVVHRCGRVGQNRRMSAKTRGSGFMSVEAAKAHENGFNRPFSHPVAKMRRWRQRAVIAWASPSTHFRLVASGLRRLKLSSFLCISYVLCISKESPVSFAFVLPVLCFACPVLVA